MRKKKRYLASFTLVFKFQHLGSITMSEERQKYQHLIMASFSLGKREFSYVLGKTAVESA